MNRLAETYVRQCLMGAESLARVGDWRDAYEALVSENRKNPDERLERALIDIMLRAADAFDSTGTVKPAQGVAYLQMPSHPGVDGVIPEIPASEFNSAALKEAVDRSGHLIVRNLLTAEAANGLCNTINQAMCARMEASDPEALGANNGPWYYASPYFPGKHSAYSTSKSEQKFGPTGSMKVLDSPRGAFQVLEQFQALNVKGFLAEYFGEPAMVATRKWVFRAAAPMEIKNAERWGVGAGWHQDGQFMGGADVGALNMWIALSDCGDSTTAPGIAVVPRRFREILEFGTGGAKMNWTVGRDVIEALVRETPLVRPYFAAGDAIFFDHLSLHSTGHTAGQNKIRYALESWFYGASGSAGNYSMPLF